MNDKLYRTQILLEPEQHQELAAIAQRENRSLSDLVREIIRIYMEDQHHRKELEALEGLTGLRQRIGERAGTYNAGRQVDDRSGEQV